MTNNTKTLLDEKIKSLADKYISEGFQVLIEPKIEQLPFDLDNYEPDIIATKDNSGLIIEVRTSPNRISVDRFQVIAEKVSQHPGWRFLLVTLEDTESQSLPGISEQLPSWEEIINRCEQAHRLIENQEIEPAFLFLWIIFEAALRKRAVDTSIPIERFPTIGLLKHFYSLGELTLSQFEFIQMCYEARNRVAHGYIEKLSLQFLFDFEDLIHELLREWITELALMKKLAEFNIDRYLSVTLMKSLGEDQQVIKEFFNSKSANNDIETRDIIRRIKESLKEKHWMLNEFLSLPEEAQRQVIDFIDFLRKRYAVDEPVKQPVDDNLANDSFIGMWRDRQDLTDSTAWVRNVRKNEWS